MIEVRVIFFPLIVKTLYGKLYLTLHFIHKVYIYKHIIVFLIKAVFYPDNLYDLRVLAVYLLQYCHHFYKLLL